MKRNLELARRILSLIAESQDAAGVSLTSLINRLMGTDNVAQAVRNSQEFIAILYHLDLLDDAGYLLRSGAKLGESALDDFDVPTNYQVTWAGHDLLESLSRA